MVVVPTEVVIEMFQEDQFFKILKEIFMEIDFGDL